MIQYTVTHYPKIGSGLNDRSKASQASSISFHIGIRRPALYRDKPFIAVLWHRDSGPDSRLAIKAAPNPGNIYIGGRTAKTINPLIRQRLDLLRGTLIHVLDIMKTACDHTID